jgi:hypothetical protein
LDLLDKEHVGLDIISMEEYLTREAGNFRDKESGKYARLLHSFFFSEFIGKFMKVFSQLVTVYRTGIVSSRKSNQLGWRKSGSSKTLVEKCHLHSQMESRCVFIHFSFS